MYICSTLYNEKTCRHILVNLSLVEVRVKKTIRRAWREHGVASGILFYHRLVTSQLPSQDESRDHEITRSQARCERKDEDG